MLKRYKFLCEKLNINYQKQLIYFISGNVILLIIGIVFLFMDYAFIGLIFIPIIIIYSFLFIYDLEDKYTQLTLTKEIAFNGFYRYLITFLENNHVLYMALKMSLEYCDEILIDDINELIINLESDPSYEPFITFANNFSNEQIKQMIMLLYQTQENGFNHQIINDMNECLISMQDDSIDKFIFNEKKKMEKYYIYPLLLTVLTMLLISISIINQIGSGNYV